MDDAGDEEEGGRGCKVEERRLHEIEREREDIG